MKLIGFHLLKQQQIIYFILIVMHMLKKVRKLNQQKIWWKS